MSGTKVSAGRILRKVARKSTNRDRCVRNRWPYSQIGIILAVPTRSSECIYREWRRHDDDPTTVIAIVTVVAVIIDPAPIHSLSRASGIVRSTSYHCRTRKARLFASVGGYLQWSYGLFQVEIRGAHTRISNRFVPDDPKIRAPSANTRERKR